MDYNAPILALIAEKQQEIMSLRSELAGTQAELQRVSRLLEAAQRSAGQDDKETRPSSEEHAS